MVVPTSEEIYRIFRELLDETPEPLRHEIQVLLNRAAEGEKTDNALLKLARQNPLLLQEFNARLNILEATRGFTPPPGPVSSTRGQVFVCPEPGCNYTFVIGEAGEDAGECPTHHERLIPRAGENE